MIARYTLSASGAPRTCAYCPAIDPAAGRRGDRVSADVTCLPIRRSDVCFRRARTWSASKRRTSRSDTSAGFGKRPPAQCSIAGPGLSTTFPRAPGLGASRPAGREHPTIAPAVERPPVRELDPASTDSSISLMVPFMPSSRRRTATLAAITAKAASSITVAIAASHSAAGSRRWRPL
jgi:hypothetical protein